MALNSSTRTAPARVDPRDPAEEMLPRSATPAGRPEDPLLDGEFVELLNEGDLIGRCETGRGAVSFEFRDVRVICAADVACVHGFVRVADGETRASGRDIWTRRTIGLRKEGGAWRVVHEHSSLPFYMDAGAQTPALAA